jgi:DNA-binding winged helix-turn-helix (wHTH) protein/tetratricopeptide (TPR) repeat protein
MDALSDAYTFAGYRLDPRARVLWRQGELVRLAPRALDLLLALVERQGDVVSKEDLLRRVWPDTVVEEANLSVNVSALRKELGAQDDGTPFIETVARRGYRFRARVEGGPAAALPAVAVLPFRVLGPDPVEDYLAVGMADALITRLARGGAVLVRPTRAVMRFADAADPAHVDIARELQVEAVIDGTLQRQGDRLRLTLHLTPFSPRFRPWAGTFDERITNVFAVQDAAAEAAARALAAPLGAPPEPAPAPRREPPNAAYVAYLRGRYFWNRLSGPWLEKALGCFLEAAELDPQYAPPHAGLADAYIVLGLSGVVPPRDAWPLAREAAARALELDPRAPEAHASQAVVALFERWDWEAAEGGLTRAGALDPRFAAAHFWRAVTLAMRGRLAEARSAHARAAELEPLSLIAGALHALQSCLQGDHVEELAAYRRAAELDPTHFLGPWGLGLALQHQGRLEEAVAEHERAVALSGGSVLMKAVLARSLALAGRTGEARALAEELDDLPYFSPYQRSTVSLALGDPARALSDLERAVEEQDAWLVWLSADPMLAELRAEPRFEAVRKRVFGPS